MGLKIGLLHFRSKDHLPLKEPFAYYAYDCIYYSCASQSYNVRSKSIRLYISPPKLMQCDKILYVGDDTPLLMHIPVITPRIQACHTQFSFSHKKIERIEQRYCIRFCEKIDNTQVQLIQMIQKVFGDNTMGKDQKKESYIRFNHGHTSGESFVRRGRAFASRNEEYIETIQRIITENCCVTIEEIAYEKHRISDFHLNA